MKKTFTGSHKHRVPDGDRGHNGKRTVGVREHNDKRTDGSHGHNAGSLSRWAFLMIMMTLLMSAVLLGGCGQAPQASAMPAETSAAVSAEPDATPEATPEVTPEPSAEATPAVESAASVPMPTVDRAGNPITVPAEVKRIVSLAPSFTETLLAMGLADRIAGIDLNAKGLAGVDEAWPVFDMMAPDAEQLLALTPDVLLASPMSTGGGDDPFKPLRDAGVCVIYVPSSASIADIQEDILFLGAVMGTDDKAVALVNDMQAALDEVAAIGATIGEKKRVFFEISAAPYIYSFGRGVFLDEMIALIGAENVFADQESWISVADEVAVATDPDVILTNVNYLPDPVAEIKAREGWADMRAVNAGDVYAIDNSASSLPNENIVKALRQMAEAVYPDAYDFGE